MNVVACSLALIVATTATAAHAGGNVPRGAALYESRCSGCHSIDTNRVGPAHRGIFGRRAGTAPGYEYSAAVRRSKIVWTTATLTRWLSNPERVIPGQKMGYSVSNADDRADLIAYLASQSGVK